MNYNFLFEVLFTAIITWSIAYSFFYSPKARIERLWKDCRSIERKLKKAEHKYPTQGKWRKNWWKGMLVDDSTIEKKKKMINALLDYYFDPREEEDKKYIEKNKA